MYKKHDFLLLPIYTTLKERCTDRAKLVGFEIIMNSSVFKTRFYAHTICDYNVLSHYFEQRDRSRAVLT